MIVVRHPFFGALEALVSGLLLPLGPLPLFGIRQPVLEIYLTHVRTWAVLHLTSPGSGGGVVVEDG
jgi:hypothetical protein